MPDSSTGVRMLTSACLAAHFTVAEVVDMVESGYAAAASGDLSEAPRAQFGSPGTSTVLKVLPALRVDRGATGVFVYTGGNRGRQVPQKVVFDGRLVRPGTHINAIGQHYPDRREIDSHVMTRATLFADDPRRSVEEDGELAIPLARGEARELPIAAAIGDVVIGKCAGRRDAEQITVFLSGGTAGEYISVAAAIAARARELGIGTLVDLPTGWQSPGH